MNRNHSGTRFQHNWAVQLPGDSGTSSARSFASVHGMVTVTFTGKGPSIETSSSTPKSASSQTGRRSAALAIWPRSLAIACSTRSTATRAAAGCRPGYKSGSLMVGTSIGIPPLREPAQAAVVMGFTNQAEQ